MCRSDYIIQLLVSIGHTINKYYAPAYTAVLDNLNSLYQHFLLCTFNFHAYTQSTYTSITIIVIVNGTAYASNYM